MADRSITGPGKDIPGGFVLANLALRFVLELCALAGLGYAGAVLGDSLLVSVVLGVGLPLVAGVLWGLFVAPKATLQAPVPVRLLVEAAVFVAAGVCLIVAGSVAFGVVLLVAWLLNTVVLLATRRHTVYGREVSLGGSP